MNIPSLIERKRDGQPLSEAEIRFLVQGYTRGDIPDYQMAALAMAILFRGMTLEETVCMTRAMRDSGQRLNLGALRADGRRVADKHSTGGVGDKVSLVLAPLAAACGLLVPMISGRGLGITGGTLDKLESIPGFRTQIPVRRLTEILAQVGCVMVGQTEEMVPADRKLYALRDVTGTVPSIPLIVSSILSKKLVEDLDALVLDVKWGSGAFMPSRERARDLATQLVEVSRRLGTPAVAFLTDMNQPLGRAVGNALEVAEALETLRGDGPSDLRELTLVLTGEMLLLSGLGRTPLEARQLAERQLESGVALRVFEKLVAAQGGDARVAHNWGILPKARYVEPICSPREGYVRAIDCYRLGLAAVMLGAGREKLGDAVAPAVGFTRVRKIGEAVAVGEPLALMHFEEHGRAARARSLVVEAYSLGAERVEPPPLIAERIG